MKYVHKTKKEKNQKEKTKMASEEIDLRPHNY